MSPREMDQQSIYLEPGKAAMLDALAKRTRIPKAVLLREAVDLLLGVNGMPAVSQSIDHWVSNLQTCELALSKARHNEDIPEEVDKACASSLAYIHVILEEMHRPRDTRISVDRNPPIGANSHKAKRASRST